MNRKQFILSLLGAGTVCSAPVFAEIPRGSSRNLKFFLDAVENLRSLRQDCDIRASVHEKVLDAYKRAATEYWGTHPDWLSYSVFGDCQIVSYKCSNKPLVDADNMYDLNVEKDSWTKHNGFRPTCLNHATECAMEVMGNSNLTKEQKTKEIGKIMEGVMHFGAIPWYKSAQSQDRQNIRYLGVNRS